MKIPKCSNCGRDGHYKSFCILTKRKPIKAGKHTLKDKVENKKFRDSKLTHEGYLICECCQSWNGSDADHIKSKGANPDKRYDPDNKRILCRNCHFNRTNHIECKHYY